ncbi:MAG: Tetratricopeptide repeat protein [Promethearchaeota archaeon]|nr:MAG: Tetratricopeptide repeat protein [Candidatus Lokiarchaeota archaeon]
MDEIQYSKEEIAQLIKEKQLILEELEKGAEYIRELSDIGLLQIEIGQYEDAQDTFSECLHYFEGQKDRLGKASVYGIFGTLYFKKTEFQKAIEYYDKALVIYEELNQRNERIMCLKGIGNCYLKLNEFNKASEIFFECCEISSANNDIYEFLDCIGQLVQIYEGMEEWEILKELYLKSLEAFKKLNNMRGMITSNFNLGIINSKQKKYENALVFFKEGTNIAIEANYGEFILKGLTYVGETLFYLGEIKCAKDEYIKALHVAKKMSAHNAITQIQVVLNSFGLTDLNIEEELKNYRNNKK